jgi:hypothetical protein
MVHIAWNYLKTRPFPHFGWVELMRIWARNPRCKSAIFTENHGKWPKILKMTDLSRLLRGQIPTHGHSNIRSTSVSICTKWAICWIVHPSIYDGSSNKDLLRTRSPQCHCKTVSIYLYRWLKLSGQNTIGNQLNGLISMEWRPICSFGWANGSRVG